MSEINTGGPAFPQVELDQVTGHPCAQHFGMTLRDYFAAHASDEDVKCQINSIRARSHIGVLPDDWASTARYMHADAMLKARSA